jgi:hypothetical protein
MSRSGYSEDCDGWALIRWRGAVTQAIRGKRGQAMLRELLTALDAMPDKRLVADSLVSPEGEFCTLGALGRLRGVNMESIDVEDRQAVARAFDVAEALAAEVMYLNDEAVVDDWTYLNFEVFGPVRPWERHVQLRRVPNERSAQLRWEYMRKWVANQLIPPVQP